MSALTVICAYRDAAAFLPDLFASLSRTDTTDVDFIFVDDASVDDSLEVVDRFAPGVGAPVGVVEIDEPRGPAAGRNAGMRAATGDYLAFIDGDDWVGPSYFSELLAWAQRLDVDFVRCDHVQVFGRHRRLTRAPDSRYHRVLDPSSAIMPEDRATMVDFPYSHSGLFHRRLYDRGLLEMPPTLRTAEDRPWVWRLHLEADSYARIESLQYFYRRGVSTSLTQVGDDRQLDFIDSFHQVIDYVVSHPEGDRYASKAYRQCLSVVAHHLDNADRLAPGLGDEMRSRLPGLCARIPDDYLGPALKRLGRHRANLVRGLDLRMQSL